jgi:hypothetical protein
MQSRGKRMRFRASRLSYYSCMHYYGDACRKVSHRTLILRSKFSYSVGYRVFQRNPCEGGVTNFTARTSVA